MIAFLKGCSFYQLNRDARRRAIDDYLAYQGDALSFEEAESRLTALCDSQGWLFYSNGRIKL